MLFVIYRFWFHSPPLRDEWVWLLVLALPVFRLRLQVYGRLWTRTPLNDWLLAFLFLTVISYYHAPYARQNYLVLMSRPLLGIWIFLYFVEHARTAGHLRWLLLGTVGMAVVLALVALTTTEWTLDKAGDLQFIIERLPRFNWRESSSLIKDMLLAFNPNEIAGALAFMTPVMVALAVGSSQPDTHRTNPDMVWRFLHISAGICSLLLLLALILTQSRFAIAGTLGSLILISVALLPHGRKRWLMIAGVILIALWQIWFTMTSHDEVGVSSRDQRTLSVRSELWDSALHMALDYPLTGIGMSMFRTAVHAEPYRIAYYEDQGTTPPHAHNEWLQVGADMGLAGLVVYVAWQIIVVRMLWYGWKNGTPEIQIAAVAVFCGLLAHAFYGLGDAITLWDRFSFIMWWLVGLGGGQYILATDNHTTEPELSTAPV